jgi:hypothetical protein
MVMGKDPLVALITTAKFRPCSTHMEMMSNSFDD